MNHILEKLKEIDKKYLIVCGVAVAIALILVLVLVFGGSSEKEKENNNQSIQNETEQSGITNDSEEDDKENVDNGQTDGSGSQGANSEDSENQSSEGQDSENQDSSNTDDENSSSESGNSDNQNNNQNDAGNGDASSKPQNKPSTGNNNSENSSESVSKPEQTPTTPSTPSTPDKEEPTKPDDSEENANTEKYTINVFTTGGHKMYNVKVNIYKDSSLSELVTTVATDSNGRANAQLEPSKNYRITLSNVPEGYKVKANYSFSGKTALIVLESSIITGKPLPEKTLKEGDVMYDFTVPSAKGGNIKISDLLKTKDLVVINFWYVHCDFCVKEFPMLEKAYLKYAKNAEVVALTPFDTMDAVKEFLAENPLRFQVGTCDTSIPNLFNVQSYPVSVFIDKYGVIREIERGALLEEDGFISVFDKYL